MIDTGRVAAVNAIENTVSFNGSIPTATIKPPRMIAMV